MNHDKLVNRAQAIATEAHLGQYRRDGITPYIEHPAAVASRVGNDPKAQVVAWLHDVIEDCGIQTSTLIKNGIPEDCVQAILLLTKSEGTSYDVYLDRLAKSPLASKVKIADMITNLADSPTDKQIKKYARGLYRLTQ